MATFPAALYSPTVVVDNVDDVLAVHINVPNDEILAIETELGTDPAGSLTDVKTRLAVSLAADGDLTLTGSSTLTISSGEITATNNLHKVETESGAATDNLATITAAADGYVLVLSCANSAHAVVIQHNVGNILTVGGKNVTMSTDGDMVLLVFSTALNKWRCMYGGKRTPTVASPTTTYNATATDDYILANAAGGAFSVNLPAATSSTGLVLTIKKIDASANAVTIDGNSSETIDGATTKALSSQYASSTIVCDGSAWFVT